MDLKFSTFSEHRKCHDRFQSLLALGKDTRFYTQLQDEFDKYSLWADSVGATHPPSSSRSLDHRLRNASPYKQETLRVLAILADHLADEERWMCPAAAPPKITEADDAASFLSGDSDSPWEVSSDSEPDLDNNVPRTASTVPPSEDLLEAVKFAIGCLYSLPLRRPAPLDRLRDKVPERREPSPYAEYDLLYIQDKFPFLNPSVQNRLGNMVTRRRDLLLYRQLHGERLDKWPERRNLRKSDDAGDEKDGGTPDAKSNMGSANDQKTATDYTKATTILVDDSNPALDVGVPTTQPNLHVATRIEDDTRTYPADSVITRELQITVPPRPSKDGTPMVFFKCNYCCIPVNIETDRAWRDHVLADLQPFLCTYPNCHLERYTFENVDAWFRHEAEFHRVEHHCGTPGHQRYLNLASFTKHLAEEHNMSHDLSLDEIRAFTRPMRSARSNCNLCFGETSNSKRHVSRHLRQIALFSLPRADYFTGDDEGDGSAQAMRSDKSDRQANSSSSGTSSQESQSIVATDSEGEVLTEQDEVPDTAPSFWDEVSTYGVISARGGRSEAPPIDPNPFRKFAEFVAETKIRHMGSDIAGNQHGYVPFSKLNEYWGPVRIKRVLQAFTPHIVVDVDLIRGHYLRIFSTLVYTGIQATGSFTKLFVRLENSDEKFPLRAPPDSWPREKLYGDIFNEISSYQWQFFPISFTPHHLQDLHFDDQVILPIYLAIPIAHNISGMVERITIHDEYNHLMPQTPDGHPATRDFVIKTYHNKKYEACYENEVLAHRRLSIRPSSNVVKFFGSFRQLNSYSLLFEYADGGDLGEFFDSTPRPVTVEDIELFWVNLLQVLDGLDRIHQLMAYNGDEVIKGIHNNIRPEHILLMKGPSGSPYDFIPKIAGFGSFSRVRDKTETSGAKGLDYICNQRYSAPECTSPTVTMITTSSDIFSFGAVLSHTAAWMVGGVGEQMSYFKARESYHISQFPQFIESGYEGCFHDTIQPLSVVAEEHNRFKQKCRQSDTVTPLVIDLVENNMLLGSRKDRLRARDLLKKFEVSLFSREPSASATIEPTGTPSLQHPASPLWSAPPTCWPETPPPTSSIPPQARLEDILDYGQGKSVDSNTATLVEYLEHNLGGHDQLFFIEDSVSMFEHKQLIVEAFNALAYIAKRLDPDEFELVFASRPRSIHKSKLMSRLRDLVSKCEFRGEGSQMSAQMAELVQHVLIPRLPPKFAGVNVNLRARKSTSVHVFTDGNWGELHPEKSGACGVEVELERLIKVMQERKLDVSQLMVHFVRFGDRENGRVHLQTLDDFGQRNRYIVDVKHIGGDVKGIMMGPLTRNMPDHPGE